MSENSRFNRLFIRDYFPKVKSHFGLPDNANLQPRSICPEFVKTAD